MFSDKLNSVRDFAAAVRRGNRYDSRIGKLVFILPAVIIIGLVVYAYVETNAPGTLVVRAETSDCLQPQTTTSAASCTLNLTVTVNGKSGQTPWTQSLSQGVYTVAYPSLQWYYTPSAKSVSVSPGLTSYAVGVYSPVGKVVSVTSSGFNTTSLTIMHGVTPVNFTNPSGDVVTFQGKLPGSPYGDITLQAGQTIGPFIYKGAGTYTFTIPSGNYTLSLNAV